MPHEQQNPFLLCSENSLLVYWFLFLVHCVSLSLATVLTDFRKRESFLHAVIYLMFRLKVLDNQMQLQNYFNICYFWEFVLTFFRYFFAFNNLKSFFSHVSVDLIFLIKNPKLCQKYNQMQLQNYFCYYFFLE